MLTKIETFYLAILRVIILVAATLALIGTIIGGIGAVPAVLRMMGVSHEAPTGGTLGQFIAEQKITETKVTASSDENTAAEGTTALPDIRAAASTIKAYLRSRGVVEEAAWRKGLQEIADGFAGNAGEYAASVRNLAEQLPKSKGKPLSEERVAQLIDWHKARFEADLSRQAAEEAQSNAQFFVSLGAAGAAFLTFVMIIFIFLFVKIERSLRLVHTMPVRTAEEIE